MEIPRIYVNIKILLFIFLIVFVITIYFSHKENFVFNIIRGAEIPTSFFFFVFVNEHLVHS